MIMLPGIAQDGTVSVESSIQNRRSVRHFTDEPVSVQELAQLLWAGQGMSEVLEEPPPGFGNWEWKGGFRTAPSAGALYPLELYLVVGTAEDIDPGVYRYAPLEHGLVKTEDGDLREALWDAALRQGAIREAPVTILIAGVVERTAVKYGGRAEQYVLIEVGAAAENIFLQAGAIGLGTVFIGAFDDEAVPQAFGFPGELQVFGIMPVGHVPPNPSSSQSQR
jgi:SagB-type dehydrogenase family enzyme